MLGGRHPGDSGTCWWGSVLAPALSMFSPSFLYSHNKETRTGRKEEREGGSEG